MKTITISINPKSFLLGVLAMGGLLLLLNFTPATKNPPGVDSPDPTIIDTRRFQVVLSERESIIIDTKTGRFLINSYIGKPKWASGDFEELQKTEKR